MCGNKVKTMVRRKQAESKAKHIKVWRLTVNKDIVLSPSSVSMKTEQSVPCIPSYWLGHNPNILGCIAEGLS